jgi:hypothetical protein
MATPIQRQPHPQLPNDHHRPRLRRDGPPLQRPHRHHQDTPPEDTRYARRDCAESDCDHRKGYVPVSSHYPIPWWALNLEEEKELIVVGGEQTRRCPRLLQRHHAADNARRARPGRHVHRIRVPEGEAGE